MSIQSRCVSSWALITHNLEIIDRTEEWHDSPKKFLLHHKTGTYTCARTINNKIFNYKGHLERLVLGTFKLQDSNIPDNFINTSSYIDTYITIEDIFKSNLKVSFENFRKEFPNKEEEMRIYLLFNKPNKSIKDMNKEELMKYCWVYIQQLPIINPNTEIKVLLKSYERENPEIKSLKWLRQKKEIEDNIGIEYEECLLAGGKEYNEIYEGLSSNFYVIINGQLHCAPDGTILLGTIMKIVLEACYDLNIKVIRKVPLKTEYNKWNGCFITSTSRLVLPITKIKLEDEKEIQFKEENKEIMRIQEYVKTKLDKQSTDIMI